MPETNDPQRHDPHHEGDDKRTEEARRRSAGEALDQRMEELTRDVPRPPRSDQDRRRRR